MSVLLTMQVGLVDWDKFRSAADKVLPAQYRAKSTAPRQTRGGGIS
mgnify:CR=1 FL=1